MPHTDLAGSNIQYHFRNEKGIETRSTITSCKIGYFMLKSDKTSDAAGKYHTYPVRINIVFVQPCICHGLVANHQGKLGEAVNFPCFFFIKELNGIKSFYFTGKLCPKLGSIKQSDHISARHTIYQSVPVVRN